MESAIYDKKVKCPVCDKEFTVTKVKAKSIKMLNRDSDYCIHYEGINPMLYEAWVCEHCGYASLSDRFEDIGASDAKLILANISSRWNSRSFSGERTIDQALEAFKLVLLNLQTRRSPSSDIAKVCIRIAWLYRLQGDEEESKFLQFALDHYLHAYENERFPVDKLDEYTCMYMIGELNRRLGKLDESVKWFSRLISSPEARKKHTLIEATRDQFQLVKEQMENKQNL